MKSEGRQTPTSTRLAFVGDVGLAHRIPEALRRSLAASEPPSFLKKLRDADLAFANLEFPFCATTDDDPSLKTRANQRDATLLNELGIDVVCLANNHLMDGGPEGLTTTRATLREIGIASFGAGETLDEATRPAILERNGIKIGFLGFVDGRPRTHDYIVRRDRGGAAPLDKKLITNSVRALRPDVDLLVVSLHQGVNYVPYASPRQREFNQVAVDAGADLVIGHHPHVIQGHERMGDALVFYSLGEFLFDPSVGNVVEPRWEEVRRKTCLLEVDFTPDHPFVFTVTPYRRDDDFEVRELKGADAGEFHRYFTEISKVYEDYNPRLYLETAGEGVVVHTLKVLLYNLKRGNVGWLLGSLSRLRGRHLLIAWSFLRRRRRAGRP